MFFRFGTALAIIFGISLVGIAIEKRNLELRREITLQSYRADQLEEQRVKLRLRAEQLGAPPNLAERVQLQAPSRRKHSPK